MVFKPMMGKKTVHTYLGLRLSNRILLHWLILTFTKAKAQPSVCMTNGHVRLVGGSARFEGRVEVCLNNEWGTVCDDSLLERSSGAITSNGQKFISVLCKQLGLSAPGGMSNLKFASYNL